MPAAKTNKRAKTEEDADYDAKASTAKSKGKGKTVSKVPAHRSRLVGRLAGLMTMPVDVFTEICFHLFPIDLLHLSWSSKRLRSLLMSKTAKSIWRRARENQLPTLPPCPDDLSEPQYIALLFTTICQKCGVNRAQRTSFVLRTRYCATCYPKYVCTIDKLIDNHSIPHIAIPLKIVDSLPMDISGRYSLEHWEKHSNRYFSFDKEEDRNEYINTSREKARKVEQHAEDVESWILEQSRIKVREKNDVSRARLEDIKKKLGDLGWEKTDYPSPYNTEWTKLTQKRQALTDKVWKNLYPKLEPMLKACKAARLEREKASRLHNRTSQIQELYAAYKNAKKDEYLFFPVSTRIFTIPSIKKLREDDDAGEVTTDRWEACLPELDTALRRGTDKVIQEVKTWYNGCVASKAPEVEASKPKTTRRGKASTSNSGQDMSLLVSAFKCQRCQEALWLPTFLQHDHFISQYVWSCDPAEGAATPTQTDLGPGGLAFDANLQTTISKMIATLGWGPGTARVQNVIAHGQRYACDRCDDKHQQPVSFGKLVSHYMAETTWYETFIKDDKTKTKNPNPHNIEPERKKRVVQTAFRILSQQDAAKMKTNYDSEIVRYAGKRYSPGYETNQYWSSYASDLKRCKKCHYLASGIDAICHMIHHLKAKHDITVDTEVLDGAFSDDEGIYHIFNPFGFGMFDPYDDYDEGYDSYEEYW